MHLFCELTLNIIPVKECSNNFPYLSGIPVQGYVTLDKLKDDDAKLFTRKTLQFIVVCYIIRW